MSRVTYGDVSLEFVDTKVESGEKASAPPRTVHEAFAAEFGIPLPDDDDEDEDRPS